MAFQGSIVSYKDRGQYGDKKWRGNTSGFIVKDYLESFHRKQGGVFVDPMVGGGTSSDVAKEMNISFLGFDLHSGFNILSDSLCEAMDDNRAHTLFYHPPYAGMIKYSGDVWGSESHPDDLSVGTVSEFLEKLQVSLNNIYDAVEPGGTYAVLMGNWRQNGKYYNLTSMTERLALGDLKEEIIKVQHNCLSDNRSYGGRLIPIRHEKLLIFGKNKTIQSFVDHLVITCRKQDLLANMTWRAAIRSVFLGKDTLSLQDIYAKLSSYAEARGTNKHWKEKIRQQLQNEKYFLRIKEGVYSTVSGGAAAA